ncbi:MAG: family 20 glycosylhydrolase [Planctomycetota bacterium]
MPTRCGTVRAPRSPGAVVAVLGCLAFAVAAPLRAIAAECPLAVRWELIANAPPVGGDGDFEARFTLTNVSAAPLGDDGWTLFFTMAPRELRPHPSPQPAVVEHLNGDWYRLRPAPGFRLEPGATVEVRYAGVEPVAKECDAPLGPYVVVRDAAGGEPRITTVADYRILPFVRREQARRGPRDRHPLPTPRERFEADREVHLVADEDMPAVVPTPVAARRGAGAARLTAAWPIECPADLEPTAVWLADRLARQLGDRPVVAVRTAGEGAVGPVIRLSRDGGAAESYRLAVAADGITIAGGDPAGVFYGAQSLLHLLPWESLRRPDAEVRVPVIEIEDRPRFPHRGLHVDVSRNFQSRETIERVIDLMAAYKLNRLLLYTTEDEGWRIEIPGLPELTEVGARRRHTDSPDDPVVHPAYGSGPFADDPGRHGSGHYSRDDFIAILRHAAARHVKVIPELNFPGHARAAIKAMEARHRRLMAAGQPEAAEEYRLVDPLDTSVYRSAQSYRDNVVSVARDSTYRFYEKVVDELAKMYAEAGLTMDSIHTGGDEVPLGAWRRSPLAADLLARRPEIGGADRLQGHFFGRLLGTLRTRGLRVLGWEEVALRRESADPAVPPVVEPRFAADDVEIYVWNNLFDRDVGIRLANAGYDVVLCNVTNFYLDLACEKDPLEPGLSWAGFVAARDAYAFAPFDYVRTTLRDEYGTPFDADRAAREAAAFTPEGRRRVRGVQAQLWGETVKGREMLEYYLLPRLIAFADTAWSAERPWETMPGGPARDAAIGAGWNLLANAIGRRELPRLAFADGGRHYRLPPPGAAIDGGRLAASTALPGLAIRYTTDGTLPTAASPLYEGPVTLAGGAGPPVQLRAFDAAGRGSRPVAITRGGEPALPVTVDPQGSIPGLPPGIVPATAKPVTVGTFAQQVRVDAALPGAGAAATDVAAVGDTLAIVVDGELWTRSAGTWKRVDGLPGPARGVANAAGALHACGERYLAKIGGDATATLVPLPDGATPLFLPDGPRLVVVTPRDVLERDGERWRSVPLPAGAPVAAAQGAGEQLAVVVDDRVHERAAPGAGWAMLRIRDETRGWDPPGLAAIAYDARGRVWCGAEAGLAVRDEDGRWRFVERDELPVTALTGIAAGPDGDVWLATKRGAVHVGDGVVEYRQGRRWLPGDDLAAVAVGADGTAWFAGGAGVGGIGLRATTLADKAAAYEEAIERFHRRTELGYVIEAGLDAPGAVATATTEDNDNDGLWTSMYGAAQCFAHAADGDEGSRERARKAFRAVKFLSDVTRGGDPAPPPGFPARSVVPVGGFDPNTRDNAARDERQRQREARWKVFEPRWPRDRTGRWYWKTDTSSDELDGHFFFYGVYHDLVARGPEERAEVAAVVRGIVDHLIAHDWALVDIDGTPTRWAQFGPRQLNRSLDWWEGRGLNSLSILSYLAVAAHVTGDERYRTLARQLVDEHGYATNVLVPKITPGVGGGNQSDDEMALMGYYHLVRLERDPRLRQAWQRSLAGYWQLEQPERNPLFNVIAAVCLRDASFTDPYGTTALEPDPADWLPDTLDTLRRFPLDLVDWRLENAHRHDVALLPRHVRPDAHGAVGVRRDGKVLPVDERTVFHWNHDPYRLDSGGEGRRLADGTSYLLPYHLARYHRIIAP